MTKFYLPKNAAKKRFFFYCTNNFRLKSAETGLRPFLQCTGYNSFKLLKNK